MEKQAALIALLKELGSVAVGFSGGVDSTYLLKIAHDTLGEKAIAVTAHSASFPAREMADAAEFCRAEGIRQIIIDTDELSIPAYRRNPKDRCYHCKKHLFTRILQIAQENGIAYAAEGSNLDDLGDYRPGLKAVAELHVRSPLREAGLTKAEIRAYSQALGLPTWDKPSFACLASRVPYGEEITAEKLAKIAQAEDFLRGMGFAQVRVRLSGDTSARIELLPADFSALIAARETVLSAFRAIGFTHISMDLQGYRTGSMNETFTDQSN